MKTLITLVIVMIGALVFADGLTVGSAVAPATPVGLPPSIGTFVGIIMAAVVCLNIVLTAVQQIFSALSKNEPGLLVTISNIVLSVAKWAAANPDLTKKTPPAA